MAATAGYREPWTGGAAAYPEADTLDALWAGVARKRRPLIVHVRHTGLPEVPCARCGIHLDKPYPVNPGDTDLVTDERGFAYVDVDPTKGEAIPRHYYCAWGATMSEVLKLRRI